MSDNIYPVHVSVKDFGAQGNGTSPDFAPIQAAIQYVGERTPVEQRGGVVYVPPGVYWLDGPDPLRLDWPNVTLLGSGPGSTKFVFEKPGPAIVAAASSTRLSSFQMIGTGSPLADDIGAIRVQGSNVSLTDLLIAADAPSAGVKSSAIVIIGANDVTVRDCKIINPLNHGIVISGAINVHIAGGVIESPRSADSQYAHSMAGIFVAQSSGVNIQGVRIRLAVSQTMGVWLRPSQGPVLIAGCQVTLESNNQQAFLTEWGQTLIAGCLVDGTAGHSASNAVICTAGSGAQVLGLKCTGHWGGHVISMSASADRTVLSNIVIDEGYPGWSFDLQGSTNTTVQGCAILSAPGTPPTGGGISLGTGRGTRLFHNRLEVGAGSKYDTTGEPRDFVILDDGAPLRHTSEDLSLSVLDGPYVGVVAPPAPATLGPRNLYLGSIKRMPNGHRITIKDETGQADTHNITIISNVDKLDGVVPAQKIISRKNGAVTLMAVIPLGSNGEPDWTRAGWQSVGETDTST